MMSGYTEGWALQHLREAKVELVAPRKMPYMALSPVLHVVRKAWNAFYHNLSKPTFSFSHHYP
jgi:hypothetical protein